MASSDEEPLLPRLDSDSQSSSDESISPASKQAAAAKQFLAELGEESALSTTKQQVYLVTFARILPNTLAEGNLQDITGLARADVGKALLDAFGEGSVAKLVVFQEQHGDGDMHFHVAVRLVSQLRFAAVKAKLLEKHKLASHFSCSRTQWWSAVRYGAMPSEKKPEVDTSPWVWTCSGDDLDLYAESQEPFCARAWKRRREGVDKSSLSSGKALKFGKPDLTAVILSEKLLTKAAVMEYAQDKGTAAMQSFVQRNQRKLDEFLADAVEWGSAREVAAEERHTDWHLVCRFAGERCAHGEACSYAVAIAEIAKRNRGTLDFRAMACALRDVISNGPSKTCRVPLVVGPTNTGKSTLVLPFDNLFGAKKVFHKPVLNSSFALRNLTKGKRFLFWDDYRPVEYGQVTVPVTTFLSLFTGHSFEIQASQSFQDGNLDFQWTHGAVLTAKEEDLWKPSGVVSAEDVRHMQSRVAVFRCTATVSKLKDTVPCHIHLAKWIEQESAAADAAGVLQSPLAELMSAVSQVFGLSDLLDRSHLPPAACLAITDEVSGSGAVHVRELVAEDWHGLMSFTALKPLEKRRLLNAAGVC